MNLNCFILFFEQNVWDLQVNNIYSIHFAYEIVNDDDDDDDVKINKSTCLPSRIINLMYSTRFIIRRIAFFFIKN